MIPDKARDFLMQPHIARLSTNGDDGYPHTVPLWYMLDGDDLVVMTNRDSVKVQNALRDPKGAITIGGEPAQKQGWLFRGDFEIATDEGHAWARRITYHYEPQDEAEKMLAEWANDDIVTMRLKVKDVIRVF